MAKLYVNPKTANDIRRCFDAKAKYKPLECSPRDMGYLEWMDQQDAEAVDRLLESVLGVEIFNRCAVAGKVDLVVLRGLESPRFED